MSGTRSTWDVGPCSNCGGDPIDPDGNACPRCGGSGRSDVIASAEWADMTDKPTLPRPKRGQVWTRGDFSYEVLADEPVMLRSGEAWPVLVTDPSTTRYVRAVPLPDGSYAPPRPELPPLSEWWVNVYPDGAGTPDTAEGADFFAAEDRVARVPLVPDLSRVVWCQGREVSS